MMKRITLFSLLLWILIDPVLFSQSRLELKNMFYDAESWILFEDYKEALAIYQRLLKVYPTNANIKYRIGQCYINTPGEKAKAVSYLEDAVKNIDPKYREGYFRETGAPYDALYYLANAYRINNQLDKALATYKTFKKNLNSAVYDSNIVNLQIKSCLNANDLMMKPLFIKEKNLGGNINTQNSEFNPVVSEKEDFLVFSRSEAFYDAILYSTKVNGQWSNPLNMNELLKVDKDIFPTSISSDGKTLYLYSSADYDGNIYTSQFDNGVWGPLVKLNDNINTKYWESHAAISHDNKKLYFTSNRKGTLGGLDIYVSTRDSTGDWGPAVNLGPTINTPYNEETPFLSKDDKTLFFSSRGHLNMGGYDIFYSTILPNGEWSVPLNAGYPLNSTDDDVFFDPLNQGYEGYYAKESSGGYGKQDIYRIEIFSDEHPRKFYVRGMAKVADLLASAQDSVRVFATNTKNNKTYVVYSNPKTGEYELNLPQGDYQISYEAEGGQKITRVENLPLNNASDTFVLPGTILPKTDFIADLTVESNRTISVSKGDTLLFPLKTEPNSILEVQHWLGDSLVSVERFNIKDSTFVYKMVPGTGDNKITFKLTDRFNNITTSDVYITREKEVTNQPLIQPEYSRIIAKKQIVALTAMLNSHADEKLKSVISEADIEHQQFGKVDDLISYLKEIASKKSISPEELDKLALKVALMDNVLSQAAVNLMAKYTEGDLKRILSELDIYKAGLKTWTDLQQYVMEATSGKIKPEDLNKIAAAILMDIDPSISVLKEKIIAYSTTAENGATLRQAINTVDQSNIKVKEKWLQAFYNESLKQGITEKQLADLLVTISSTPGTTTDKYLQDLISHAEEPLLSSLKTLNLKKEKIKSPQDLITYLLTSKDKTKYPEEAVFKSIADLVTSKDIPADVIASHLKKTTAKGVSWIIWLVLAAGACLVFFILWKRRKDNRK